MITLYDMAAATVYTQAWLADEHQWIFNGLPAEVPTDPRTGQHRAGAQRPRPRRRRANARYDSASRTAIVRVGSLTWTVQDQAAADSMREAWRHIAELAPIVLGRQAPTRRHR